MRVGLGYCQAPASQLAIEDATGQLQGLSPPTLAHDHLLLRAGWARVLDPVVAEGRVNLGLLRQHLTNCGLAADKVSTQWAAEAANRVFAIELGASKRE